VEWGKGAGGGVSGRKHEGEEGTKQTQTQADGEGSYGCMLFRGRGEGTVTRSWTLQLSSADF
jgi:hypothetical protein